MKPQIKDITGNKYHKLTAIRYLRMKIRVDGRNNAIWLFQCDCGKKIEALGRYVERGHKKSCGCHVRRGNSVPAYNTYKKNYADGNLTFEQFYQMSQLPCYYCGKELSNCRNYHGHSWKYNGLDRLNNSRGHDHDNVVPCCWDCNQRKSNTDIEQFKEWIKVVYERLQLNG